MNIKKRLIVLWNRLRYLGIPTDIVEKYPDIENFHWGSMDLLLSIDEGITVPLVEYAENDRRYRRYIIRMKHPTREKMTISPEVPRRLDQITDPEIWEHEFVELAIREILHKKLHDDSGSSWGDKPGKIPTFIYNLPTGKHPVAHILSALFTVSGYDDRLISPKEYTELLPWRQRD
jgi:hypothetical protein